MIEVFRRFAWLFGVAAVACLVVFSALWAVIGELTPATSGFGIAAGILFALFALLDRDRLGDAARSRSTRYEAGALVVLALGIAVFAAAMWLVREHDTSWDLTRDHRHTLSDATIKVLEGLDEDVTVYAFFQDGSPEQASFHDLVTLAQQHSPRLHVEFVDPLTDALRARDFKITNEYGTVVLVAGDKQQRLEADFKENALANALVRLLSGADHVICWSIGHGEADPDEDFDASGMGWLVTKLEGRNFKVKKSRVLTEGIDASCEAVVIAGARTDWAEIERERLAAYVAGGGRVLLLSAPAPEGAGTPEFDADMARYGVTLSRDLVLEADPEHNYPGQALFVYYGEDFLPHPITTPIKGAVVLAPPRSVVGAERDGLKVTDLLRTTDRSWAETDLEHLAEAAPDEGVERTGPIPVFLAVEVTDPAVLGVKAPATTDTDTDTDTDTQPPATKAGGRLVVVGDAAFAANDLVAYGNNQDVVLNSLAWLVDETDQLGDRTTDEESDQLQLSSVGAAVVSLVGVIFVPGLALLVAVVVLLRRRLL